MCFGAPERRFKNVSCTELDKPLQEGAFLALVEGSGMTPTAVLPVELHQGLHLVVEDLAQARAELIGRGVEVGEIHDFGGGVRGANFSDPDGNTFELQEMAWRKGAAY